MTKAFENTAFLNSPSARSLRMLAEYLEPEARLRRYGIRRAVTFWGSARTHEGAQRIDDGRDYYDMARMLARRLVEWTLDAHPPGDRFHILTGAGPGIMEAAHAGGADVNPNLNVGLNIVLPHEQSANRFVPPHQLFEFHYFFTRKFWFVVLSRALVVFPGGFGTLDELFELLTLIQTGKARARPIVLFGVDYWNDVINLEGMVRQGMIAKEDLGLITRVDTVEEAYNALTASLHPTEPPIHQYAR